MPKVFISYSRKDISFARLLYKDLKDKLVETWIDWEDIAPSTDWLHEVYMAIEACDAFVFVVSATSLASEICSLELEHARKNHKRLIPIILPGIDQNLIPADLSALHWIEFYQDSGNSFSDSTAKLIEAIMTDFDWVKDHTRLQTKALEWLNHNKEKSYLLQGSDLRNAEKWQIKSFGKQPGPTIDQIEYLMESRKLARKQVRNTWIYLSTALLAAILFFSSVMYLQRQNQLETSARQEAEFTAVAQAVARSTAEANVEAEKQQRILQEKMEYSRSIADAARTYDEGDFSLKTLLSIEANNIFETFEAIESLTLNLESDPRLVKIVNLHETWVNSMEISPDGMTIATGSGDGLILLWDYENRSSVPFKYLHQLNPVTAITFSSDNKFLASGDGYGNLIVWDLSTYEPILKSTLHKDLIETLQFSSDDSRIYSFSRDEVIHVLKLTENEIEYSLSVDELISAYPNSISSAVFSDYGDIMALGSCIEFDEYEDCLENKILLWDLKTNKQVGPGITSQTNGTTALALSEDNSLMAVGGLDYQIEIWDLNTYELMKSISPIEMYVNKPSNIIGNDGVRFVKFNPNGTALAASAGGINILHSQAVTPVFFWWMEDRVPQTSPLLHPGSNGSAVHSFIFGERTSEIIIGGVSSFSYWQLQNSSHIFKRIRDHEILNEVDELSNFEIQLNQVSIGYDQTIFSPDKQSAIILQENNGKVDVSLYGASGKIEIPEIQLTENTFDRYPIYFSDNSQMLLIIQPDIIFIYDITNDIYRNIDFETCTYLPEGIEVPDSMNYCDAIPVFSDDNTLVALRSSEYTNQGSESIGWAFEEQIIILNIKEERIIRKLDKSTTILSMEKILFSNDEKQLIVSSNNSIIIYNLEDQKIIAEIDITPSLDILNINFAMDDRYLILFTSNAGVFFIDTNSYTLLSEPIFPIDFGPEILNMIPIGNSKFFNDPEGKTMLYFELLTMPATKYLFSLDEDVNSWKEIACQIIGRNIKIHEWNEYFPDKPYQTTCADNPIHYSLIDEQIQRAIQYKDAGEKDLAAGLLSDILTSVVNNLDASTPMNANSVCWFGTLLGYSELVIPACNLSVELDPETGSSRDSRGIALALSGEFEAAIEDFEYFISWAQEYNIQTEYIPQRESWILNLQNGENPFTDSLLEELLNQ
ncbi:TIR domain-containing protein [Chloroflexota bacterium]